VEETEPTCFPTPLRRPQQGPGGWEQRSRLATGCFCILLFLQALLCVGTEQHGAPGVWMLGKNGNKTLLYSAKWIMNMQGSVFKAQCSEILMRCNEISRWATRAHSHSNHFHLDSSKRRQCSSRSGAQRMRPRVKVEQNSSSNACRTQKVIILLSSGVAGDKAPRPRKCNEGCRTLSVMHLVGWCQALG